MKIDRLVRSQRKSISIHVAQDGTLEVRVPTRARLADIQAAVDSRAGWIMEVRARLAAARQAPTAAGRAADGRYLYYLGQVYRLRCVDRGPAVALDGAEMLVNAGGAPETAPAVLEAWYRRQARAYLEGRTQQLAAQWGFRYGQVRIGSARTRWGSCSTSGTISYPWRLVMAPPAVVDYVIAHELAHTEIPNHSRAFWQRLNGLVPDCVHKRAWLKEHNHEMVV
jgi:predicted metal-dependent hydrolase